MSVWEEPVFRETLSFVLRNQIRYVCIMCWRVRLLTDTLLLVWSPFRVDLVELIENTREEEC